MVSYIPADFSDMTLYHVDIGYRQNVVAENYTRTKCIGNPDKMLPGDTGIERLNLGFGIP